MKTVPFYTFHTNMEVESKGLILSESQEIGKDNTDVKEETDEKDVAKDVSTEIDSKTGPTSPARSNPSSPEPNCAICLGKLENKSFTDSCFHQFCFTCLLEWSKVKSVCPLCKTSFQSIIHNVKSIEEYDQYHVQHEQPTTWENPDGRRFRYRSTLTRERRRDIALRHIYLNHRIGHRTVPSATVSTVETRASRRTRQTLTHEGSDFRSQVYLRELRAIPHDQGHCVIRYRETTPRFFHENPACTHRLLPWLTRELNVLLYHNDAHVTFVLDIIMSLITRFDIRSQEFREHISPYIARRTDHFVHEFYVFARSPWDMATYDRNITYLDADRIESSGSDSDVVFVEEARPSVRVEPVEPAAQQRQFYVDVENADTVGHQPLASNWPLERVRLFLNNLLQDDSTQNFPLCTVTPMWARTEEVEDSSSTSSEEINVTSAPSSPLPGPSGLSSTSLHKPDRSSPAPSLTSVSSDDTISIRSTSAVTVNAVAEDCPVDPEECLVIGVVKGVKERTPELIDLVSSDDGKRNPANGETTSGDAVQPKKKAKRKKKKRSSSRSRSRKGSRSNGGKSPSRSGSSSSRHRKGHSSSSKSRHSGHRRHHRSRSPSDSVDRSKSSSHRHRKLRPRDHSNDQERGSGHDTR